MLYFDYIVDMRVMGHQMSSSFTQSLQKVKRFSRRSISVNKDDIVLQPIHILSSVSIKQLKTSSSRSQQHLQPTFSNSTSSRKGAPTSNDVFFHRLSIYIMIKIFGVATRLLIKQQQIPTLLSSCRHQICHYWNKPYQFESFPLFKQGQNVQLPTLISQQMLQSKQTVRLDNFSPQKSQQIANFINKYSTINPKTVRTHAVVGSGLFLQRKFKEASHQFTKARSIDKNVEFVIQISICLIQLGNYFEGIKMLEKQLVNNQNNGLLYHNLAVCYYLIGELKTSLTYFYKSYQINQYISQEFKANAEELYLKQQYQNAIPFFIKLLFVKQTKKQVLLKLKYCYIMSDKISQAIQFYSYLQQIDSQRIQATISLGLLYFQTGRIQQSKPILESLSKLATQHNFTINLYLGTIYIKQSRNQEALVCFNRCYQLNENDSMLLGCLSSVNIKLKEYEKAQIFCYKSLELDDNNSMAWLNLGLINIQKKNIWQALINMEKSLQVDTDNLLACTKIAEILHILGQEVESAKYIQKALQIQKRMSKSD